MTRQVTTQGKSWTGGRILLLAGVLAACAPLAWAETPHTIVGITSVKSTVQDISGDAVQLMLINALMKTDRFSIRPPDKSGGFPGVEYVFEPTLTQAKANKKVMGFLKDVLTSESPLNLDVRIFETKSNSLVGVITAKSTDIKSDGMDTAGALLGALTASKSESASASPSSEADKLEERLGPLMTHAADLLATRYGAAAGAQGGAQPSGTPWRR